jgi:copper(I)-binding protein
MAVTGAQAYPIPGSGNPVIVTALITNKTNRGDMLLGGSCPIAKTARIYSTSGAWPIPTDGTGMADLRVMSGWRIDAGGTIQLAIGDGEMVLNGLSHPLVPGDKVQVEFDFSYATPVTVTVLVGSAPS